MQATDAPKEIELDKMEDPAQAHSLELKQKTCENADRRTHVFISYVNAICS